MKNQQEVISVVQVHKADLTSGGAQKVGLPKPLVGGMTLNTPEMPVCAAGRHAASNGASDIELSYTMARGCAKLLDGEVGSVELIGRESDAEPSGIHIILGNGSSHAWIVPDIDPTGATKTLRFCGMPFSSQLLNYNGGIAAGLFLLLNRQTYPDFTSSVADAVKAWAGSDETQKAQALALMADELTYRLEEMIEGRDPLGIQAVVMDREQPTGFEKTFDGGQELKEAFTTVGVVQPAKSESDADTAAIDSETQAATSFVGDLPQKLIDAVIRGKHVLLTGPTATGKTLCVEEVCLKLKAPLTIIRGSEGLEDRDLIGATTLTTESSPTGEIATKTHFTYGPIPEAMMHGRHQYDLYLKELETARLEGRTPKRIPPSVLLVDEINRLQTRFQNLLLSTMNVRKATTDYYLRIPDNNEEVTCPAGFLVIIGARNVGGSFIGTNPMDIALERRFYKKIDLDYLPSDAEADLVKARTGLTAEVTKVIVKVASDTRYQLSQLRAPLDTDTLLKWAEELAHISAQGQMVTDQVLLQVARDVAFGVVLNRTERGGFDPASEAILTDNISESWKDVFKDENKANST